PATGPAWPEPGDATVAARPTVLRRFLAPSDTRLWRLLALLRRGLQASELVAATGIAPWFVSELERLVDVESRLRESAAAVRAGEPAGLSLLFAAKRAAFSDRDIATIIGGDATALAGLRASCGMEPGFAMVDTCAAEFVAETPYFYSTYAATGSEPEAPPVAQPAAVVIGSGPVRIGQGIEFDYCAVQAADTLRAAGWSAVMINSNPETVSTDFDASTRLYFEPLDAESVLAVLRAEQAAGEGPLPAVVQFGGQTPLNLAAGLVEAGIPLLGTDLATIDAAEERVRFAALVERLGIPQPEGGMARSFEEALVVAERIGYPVMVRPSFVIGGLAIDVAYGPEDLARQLALATSVDEERPVRMDAYLEGMEVDVDAICDGQRVLIPGLIEHVERAGVHSGDSIGILPPQRISPADQALIVEAMTRITLALGVRGLVNAQFIVRADGVFLIEVNPRASRTVPFTSKVTGVPMVELAMRIALGEDLAACGWPDGLLAEPPVVAVKAPVFSTAKLRGVDPSLGPFMQSTGEVIGLHTDLSVAMAKALAAASLRPPVPVPGADVAMLSIADRDKPWLGDLAAALGDAGYRFMATSGTARELRAMGHEVAVVARVADGLEDVPTIVEAIGSGVVSLVVNTPSPRSGPVRDAAAIRHAAIAEGILCLTSIETAVEAARSLDPGVRERMTEVRTIERWRTRASEVVSA
ncbi:MAG: carbamoyl-phosphate synthase large subunit, partial [Chloroflexi bacterium]|nr:carbamoyl-phosphate synthase large subunit [Chloroflexota bacterium]